MPTPQQQAQMSANQPINNESWTGSFGVTATNAQQVDRFYSNPIPATKKINQTVNDISNYQMFSFPSDRPKYWCRIDIQRYSRNDLMQMAVVQPTHSIALPLPLQLVDAHGVAYDETPLGAVLGNLGDATMKAMKTVGEAGAGLQDTGFWGNLAGAVGGVAANLLGDAGQSAIDAARIAGYSPNQFLTILLKGPEYKRHELSWRLSPNTPQESEEVRQIIKTLNNAMAPGLYMGGALFTFPRIFRISLIPNSKYLFKFKPAVLENFSVNYAAGGVPAFYRQDARITDSDNGGFLNAPESFELRMRFLELEFWLRNDFGDSNEPQLTDEVNGSNYET